MNNFKKIKKFIIFSVYHMIEKWFKIKDRLMKKRFFLQELAPTKFW